jgi:hypothetical protein
MNILLSLLIYNPIEAYTMILLCDIITGSNTKLCIKKIPFIYLFSIVNLFIQSIPYLIQGTRLFAIVNILTGYFVVSISIKYFYSIILSKIAYLNCVIAQFINTLCIIVICSIADTLFNIDSMFINNNILHEFIVNIIIFSVQIIVYKIIKRRICLYEKSI